MIDRIGEDNARLPIAVRVLLPIQEVVFRTDFQGVIGDTGTAVRSRPEADDLGPQTDRAGVVVPGDVVQCGRDHDEDSAARGAVPQQLITRDGLMAFVHYRFLGC
jgi:hypothetical protein